MLYHPHAPPIYRVMGIDPGSHSLGLAILDYHVTTGSVCVREAITHTPSVEWDELDDSAIAHRFQRLRAHQTMLESFLIQWNPNRVCCESPFLGRFPQAFGVLVECLCLLRQTVWMWNPGLIFETIDPPTVKRAVGVSGRSGDKEAIRFALSTHPQLAWYPTLALELLDEHAIDAIAVGCYTLRTLGCLG